MESLAKQLKAFGHVRSNVALAKFSSFKIGGPAQFFIEIDDRAKLAELLRFVTGRNIKYFILGGGSNVLFPDDGIKGAVIRYTGQKITVSGNTIVAEAGAKLSAVVEASLGAGLAGFEWAAGIPGTVGGAVRGNAGAKYKVASGEMKDSVVSVTAWSSGEVTEFANADCAFAYRSSVFKETGDVVLETTIALKPGNKVESLAATLAIIGERQGKQPTNPSAGSFFKNVFLTEWKRDPGELPERFLQYKKIAAGWLIETADLKGYRVGGAMVSDEHANFIINKGEATQADVLAVVEKVQAEVYTRFGIHLEPEVQIVTS